MAAGLFLWCCVAASPAEAGTTDFTVTKTADTNDGFCNSDCSLREAIIRANVSGADSVFVPAGVYKLTIQGDDDLAAMGDLDVRRGMSIRGDGARSTIIDGNGIDRVFHTPFQNASTPFNFGVFDVKITGGRTPGPGGGIFHDADDANLVVGTSTIAGNRSTGGPGGGIDAQRGPATINRSTISGNRAPAGTGGGIFSGGAGGALLTVKNSTISGNTARFAGAIITYDGADIRDSTIAYNSSRDDTGGIFSNGATIHLKNTIVSNNKGPASFLKNCGGGPLPISDGNNLEKGTSCGLDEMGDINADPKLGELRNNGGPTKTHHLRSGSPAIDAAGFPFEPTDQRGVTRPQGPGPDIGAFERFFNG
jgi:CSLREA domain-containing protein